jgi:hypothetical protein
LRRGGRPSSVAGCAFFLDTTILLRQTGIPKGAGMITYPARSGQADGEGTQGTSKTVVPDDGLPSREAVREKISFQGHVKA